MIVRVLVEGGVVLLVVYLAFFAAMMRRMWRLSRRDWPLAEAGTPPAGHMGSRPVHRGQYRRSDDHHGGDDRPAGADRCAGGCLACPREGRGRRTTSLRPPAPGHPHRSGARPPPVAPVAASRTVAMATRLAEPEAQGSADLDDLRLSGAPEREGAAAQPRTPALFTAATYVAQVLMFVAGLLQKGLLGPVGAGYWALMQSFWVYLHDRIAGHHGRDRAPDPGAPGQGRLRRRGLGGEHRQHLLDHGRGRRRPDRRRGRPAGGRRMAGRDPLRARAAGRDGAAADLLGHPARDHAGHEALRRRIDLRDRGGGGDAGPGHALRGPVRLLRHVRRHPAGHASGCTSSGTGRA